MFNLYKIKQACFAISFLLASLCQGQENFFLVEKILIEGNKKTKGRIIIRELDISQGDTILTKDLTQVLYENKKRILNTGLFNNVVINIKDWKDETQLATLYIEVTENWYIYPAPIFELADRNFNVWWNEQGRSLERVNYGARVSHINLSGNKDKLKLIFQRGYTDKYELDYSYPYLNQKQTLGAGINFFYSENTEIGYQTLGNKTQFYSDRQNDRVLLKRFRLSAKLDFRPNLYQYHKVRLEFHRNEIDDFVANELNPDYFIGSKKSLRFIKLNYEFRYDKRIFNLYPEGGYLIGINIDKSGLGIFNEFSNLSSFVFIEKFFNPVERLIFAISGKGKLNLSKSKMAFANNTGLGYGRDIVSGYELYVVDGTNFFLGKTSMRLKVIDKLFNIGKAMPMAAFRFLDMKAYITFNFDTAFVRETSYIESNTLNNRWIYGYGPGVDFIIYNNYLFQIQYSFNQLGEQGVYIHNQISF